MNTLEETIREKLATGYDPVTLSVSAKGVNEANIEVDIEGISYSVVGNDVKQLGGETSASGDTPAEEATQDTEDGVPSQEELDKTAPHPEANIHGIGPDVGGGPNPNYEGGEDTQSDAGDLEVSGDTGDVDDIEGDDGAEDNSEDGGSDDSQPSEGSDETVPEPAADEGDAEVGTSGGHSRPVTDEDQDGDGVDDDLEARIAAVLEGYGASELRPVGTADNGATEFETVTDDPTAARRGTLLQLEEFLKENSEETPEGGDQAAA